MATSQVVAEAQKLESCGATGPISAAGVSKGDSVPAPPKVLHANHGHQPTTSTVPVPGRHTSSPSVMVVSKVATPGRVIANGQPQVTKAALSQVASMNQATTPGRTVVITVPRAAGPQPVTVNPRLPQAASTQLPANIQIPTGELQHAAVCGLHSGPDCDVLIGDHFI